MTKNSPDFDYDYIVIGSGFGGSVSALRLAEKGYNVCVIEKGRWFSAQDFPKTSWNVRRWFWTPFLRFYGFFKLTFMRHVTILSGVGVGGGSLVYANTLPVPKDEFFNAPSWSHLADWKKELQHHYTTATEMLGATPNPRLEHGDIALKKLAEQISRPDEFEPTNIGVFLGEANKTVPDPYFGGSGPERSGCTFCGGCMVGCRYNAKNSLDKNYLHFAQKHGARIQAESEVTDVIPLNTEDGSGGYLVRWRPSTSLLKKTKPYTCKGIIFAAGVLGTIPLLLQLKNSTLPRLSGMIGHRIRTNSEAFVGVLRTKKGTVFSDGVAIGSILHTDKYSHLEPVRYSSGSGFWRILMAPMVDGSNIALRLLNVFIDWIRHPIQNLKSYFVWDWAKHTQILMYMQTINSTLRFKKGIIGLKSSREEGAAPTAFIPEARELALEYAKIVDGKPGALITETLLGRPTTAHILGGAVMGVSDTDGVIDKDNRVFNYQNMYICDGSMISANPGVNPSLTMTALTERAMSKIPVKDNR